MESEISPSAFAASSNSYSFIGLTGCGFCDASSATRTHVFG